MLDKMFLTVRGILAWAKFYFHERGVSALSRLLKIELENFMSLPKAVLEFDNSGIISPVGYNDSGKSAITRALEVLWYDAYPASQVKFITDGTESFTITNYFDDGVVISRSKFSTGASHWLMKQGDVVIYDNQLANGTYASSKGVPESISRYLSVAKDDATGEILNIRRNTNKLLLIGTTGGENYKVFNNLCQGERLAFAITKLNEDVNKSNRELSAKQSRLVGKKEALDKMHVFDEATEAKLLQSSKSLSADAARLDKLITIAEKLSAFHKKRVVPEIPAVDTSRLEMLCKAKKTLEASRGRVISEIPVVDTNRLEMLVKMKNLWQASQGTVIPPIPVIDTTRLAKLIELSGVLQTLTAQTNEIAAKSQQYRDIRAELNAVATQNQWQICKNCGEVVAFEHDC